MSEFDSLANSLKNVRHFKELPFKDLVKIVMSGRVRRVGAGSTIFEEGAPSAGMHVLMQGEVDLLKTGPQGQLMLLNTLTPVIMFNEVAVLDGGPNPIRAEAAQDCTLWVIAHEDFEKLLPQYPQIGLGLLYVLARRQRLMLSRYEDVSFRSVQARTAKLLLELSQNGKRPIERRSNSIADMAARIITAPEVVSRALNVMNTAGFIATSRPKVEILDPQGLADLAQVQIE